MNWSREKHRASNTPRPSPPNPQRLAGVRSLIGIVVCFFFVGACATTGSQEPAEYVFYPGPPETPRIQFLATLGDEWDVGVSDSWLENFLFGAREPAKFAKPYGIDIRDGKIFVVDTIATGIAVLDLVNKRIETLGSKGPGSLQKPINIAVDEDGTRYVTDRMLNRVMVYDAENRYLKAFGDPKDWKPTDVVISGDELYVADRENGKIFVLDKHSGEELRRLGREGVGDADLLFPSNLAIDVDGNIYVSDTMNARIQKIDPEGEHLQRIGGIGDSLGQFTRPKGIAVDRENRLYAVDSAFMNIQVFDAQGELLLVFGGGGFEPGNMYLPAKVKIDYDNVELFARNVAPGFEVEYLILLTNQYGPNKINVYGFLKQNAGE